MDTIFKKQVAQKVPITMRHIDKYEMEIKKLGGQPEIIFKWLMQKEQNAVSPIVEYLQLAVDALKRGLTTNEIINNL